MMRRVKKEEVKFDRFIQPDGLEYCLACWKDWLLSDDRDLSASRMKLEGGDEQELDENGNPVKKAYENDCYAEQRKADNKIGEAANTEIEDLSGKLRHTWAIKKLMGIATVWNFPQIDYMATAIEAKKQLEIKLRKNIVTAIKF